MRSELPDPAKSEAGGTIGKYRIVGRIGSGGFGTVFEAWDPVIKRPVAIKVCDAGRDVQARFLQEAELAGRLHHPNITTIYECGMEGETPYLVQEFLGGEDLSALIARREPIELADKIKILVGVALGPRLRAPRGRGPSRRQARQRPGPREPDGQDHGLRDRQGAGHSERRDGHGHHRRLFRLHGARAGVRRPDRRAGRHLLVRRPRVRALELPEGLCQREPLSPARDDREGGTGGGPAPGGAGAADGARRRSSNGRCARNRRSGSRT